MHSALYAEPHSKHCHAFSSNFINQPTPTFPHFLQFACIVAVNEAGDTPLSLECSRGDLEMVKALMNKRVDPNSKCLSVAVMLLKVVFHRASQQGW